MPHAAATWTNLRAIREQAPLIHNIANYVSMEVVANCLLALGASPAMVHAEEEVEDFVGIARALVINIGTLSPPWVAAMQRAARRTRELGKPWVLDPVGCGATPYRTRVAAQLVELQPSVIRGNASELLALAGAALGPTKGVDSTHSAEEASEAAADLARRAATVVAVTGAVDRITDGERWLRVSNGDVRMTRVTALGCSASAVIGAFLVVESDPLVAAAQGLSVFGLAGERAAARAWAGVAALADRRRAGRARSRDLARGGADRVTRWHFDPTLYLVTDPEITGGRDVIDVVGAAVRGGVTLVQLRDKEAGGRALLEEARALKALLDPLAIPLIVNDRVDIALAAGAAGSHVGQSDLPAVAARALLGPGADSRPLDRSDRAGARHWL